MQNKVLFNAREMILKSDVMQNQNQSRVYQSIWLAS